MDFSYISLDPVQVTRPTEKEMLASRTWQGIPGIQKMPSGRLFAIWYAGGHGEGRDNYAQMAISDDDGATWTDEQAHHIEGWHLGDAMFDLGGWKIQEARISMRGAWSIYGGVHRQWQDILN